MSELSRDHTETMPEQRELNAHIRKDNGFSNRSTTVPRGGGAARSPPTTRRTPSSGFPGPARARDRLTHDQDRDLGTDLLAALSRTCSHR
ncbi:hypothetical protein GCM10009863_41930 [Streptomyces axinellae]|uniref:Uncharacterized protein n=1 Tax=Streptomyces axinellae TaxID=552788 RepID=A0ABN3QD10_9ACTN